MNPQCVTSLTAKGVTVYGTDVHLTKEEIGFCFSELLENYFLQEVDGLYRVREPNLLLVSDARLSYLSYQFLSRGKPVECVFDLFTKLLVLDGTNVDPLSITEETLRTILAEMFGVPQNDGAVFVSASYVKAVLHNLDSRMRLIA